MHRSIIVCLFFLCTAVSILKGEEVHFIKDDLKTALDRANSEGKLIFVDFWASYCSPCRLMEEYTFPDPTVTEKLNSAYVPVKIDIQSFDGYDLKTQYKVTRLPTLLILDSKGHLVARYEESMGATTLANLLEKYDQTKYRRQTKNNLASVGGYNATTAYSNSNKPVTLGSTRSTEENALLKPTSDNNNNPTERSTAPTNYSNPTRKITVKPAFKENVSTASSGNTNSKKRISFPTQGFTIKIGTFATDTGLRTTSEKYKAKIAVTEQKMLVQAKNISGRLLHRLLIGNFPTRLQAENFKQAQHLEGNVMAFAVLK